MQAGAITENIDVAQMVWWTFFLAFLGIVYYLRREDKREGYPLDDPGGPPNMEGFPPPPSPVTYLRDDGSATAAPHHDRDPPMSARATSVVQGTPMAPVGNRLTAALGPGTYTMRRDEPFRSTDGAPQVQPLRAATGWSVMPGDADPRGMRVLDLRYKPVGRVRELWVDRGVKILRYLEIDLDEGSGPVLLPIHHCDIDEREREVRVTALRRGQFATVPRQRSPDQITAREEDQLNGYYAGGLFYVDDFTGDAP